jgi:large subunit ribosomal protein L28
MRHTRRRWRANIQHVRVIENGAEKRMYMCTQCIKTREKTH